MEKSPATIDVLIVRLTALGDVVQACDALQVIRQEFPQIHWHWAVADIYAPLLEGEGLSNIIPVPRRWSFKKWWKFKQDHRHRHFDLIVDTQTLLKSWLVGLALSKTTVVAWGPQKSRDWLAPRLASHVVNVAPVNSRSATLTLFRQALRTIGMNSEAIHSSIQTKSIVDKNIFKSNQGTDGLWQRPRLKKNPRIICSVGAGWPTKQLSVEAWSTLLACIRKDYPNAPICFLIGSTSESDFLAKAMPQWTEFKPSILQKMTLGELKQWFSSGDLFIGMDSGPSHLAASRGLDTLIWYGPSRPEAYDRFGIGPHAPRGQCHLNEQFEQRCNLLRKCSHCSALETIDISKAWKNFQQTIVSE